MNSDQQNRQWSRPMLRQLLMKHRVGIGARILVVGFTHGRLGHLLTTFGLSVQELDENPQNVLQARRDFPDLKIEHWPEGEPLPVDAQSRFEIVLVRQRTAFHQDTLSARVTQMTADLLSVLSPGGALVFVDEFSDQGNLLGHTPSCWLQMLSFFPGVVQCKRFRRSLLTLRTWWSLLTRGRRGRREMVSLRIPDVEYDRTFWRKQGMSASLSAPGACCASSASASLDTVKKAA